MHNSALPQNFRIACLILCTFCSLAIFAGIPLFEAVGWVPSGLWKHAGVAAPLAAGAATVLTALFLSRSTPKRDLSLLILPFTWNFFAISLGLILMAGRLTNRRSLALLILDAAALVIGYHVFLKSTDRNGQNTSSNR